jgi:hypothetical protein
LEGCAITAETSTVETYEPKAIYKSGREVKKLDEPTELEGSTGAETSVFKTFETKAIDRLGRQLETLGQSTKFDGSTGAETRRIFETF